MSELSAILHLPGGKVRIGGDSSRTQLVINRVYTSVGKKDRQQSPQMK